MLDITKITDNRYRDLFNAFLEHLTQWGTTGVEPAEATAGVRRFLDLKEARLKAHGLTEHRTFESDHDRTKDFAYGDHVWATGRPVRQRLTLFRGDQRIHQTSKRLFMRMLVLDAGDAPGQKDQRYACPNCGAIETLDRLSGAGCSYCRSRFMMSELFPKIMNYYALDDIVEADTLKRHLKVFVIAGGATFAGAFLFSTILSGKIITQPIETIFGALTVFAFGALFAFLVVSMMLIFAVVAKGLIELPAGVDMIRSKRQLKQYLAAIDPQFSYEYIESKIVSLLQQIVFSDDASTLTIYQGVPLGDRYKSILDLNYRGIFGLVDGQTHGDTFLMVVDVPMQALVMSQGRIREQKKIFRMTLTHRIDVPIRYNFSIELVKCASCGASFDAYTEQHCPYCGSFYELHRDDWVVLSCTDA